MQQSDTLSKVLHSAERGIYRSHIINYVLSVLMLILLIWATVSWWRNRITISNARIVGESTLCGGDWLVVAYDLHVNGEGVLIRDASTQRISPPHTIIFSEWLRFPLKGPLNEEVVMAWQVPEEFLDFETGRMGTIPPGEYLRNIAVSSSSRSSAVAISSVNFTIRSDCQ